MRKAAARGVSSRVKTATQSRFTSRFHYAEDSNRPLEILAFLTPLVAFYECGLVFWLRHDEMVLTNRAHSGLVNFFRLFGVRAEDLHVSAMSLPSVALILTLLIWQIVAGLPWIIRWRTIAFMWMESFALAAPLLVFAAVIGRAQLLMGGNQVSEDSIRSLDIVGRASMAAGAGIYEELLFEPKISDLKDFNSISLFKNLFLNGWFPIFPWIIFPLIGFLVKKRKLTLIGFNYFVISLILFVFTTILKFNETNYLREEAIELFYPANLTYIFLAVSFIVLIKNIVHFLPFEKLKIFQLFGRASLFFYVFHLTMVHLFFKKFSENLEIHFINTFILFFLFFLVVALIINQFKKSKLFLKDNFILKTIFGN